MQITEEYRKLNEQLHESNAAYGTSGQKWAGHVSQLKKLTHARDILDFGCGKRTLETSLGYEIRNYDPCIPGLDSTPEPADIVVCSDVLEHIEPECLDDVLDELKRVTKAWGFCVINTGPAIKFLADGRNAHLIQEPWSWWEQKLSTRFQVVGTEEQSNDVAVCVRSLSSVTAQASSGRAKAQESTSIQP